MAIKNELADFLSSVKGIEKDVAENLRKTNAALLHIDDLRRTDQRLELSDEHIKTLMIERLAALKETLLKEIDNLSMRVNTLASDQRVESGATNVKVGVLWAVAGGCLSLIGAYLFQKIG